MRVLLIAENASFRYGGEAVLPLHYFRVMRSRGVHVWIITNQRNQAELEGKLSPDEMAQFHFVPDDRLHRITNKIGRRLPQSLASFTVGLLVQLVDQTRAR